MIRTPSLMNGLVAAHQQGFQCTGRDGRPYIIDRDKYLSTFFSWERPGPDALMPCESGQQLSGAYD